MYKHRKGKRSRRERGSNASGCLAWSLSQRSDGLSSVLRKLFVADGVFHGPKCLGKRQFEASKVISRRSFAGPFRQGKLTGNGMLTAAGVRDEEEANAPGNAGDRDCDPLPAKEMGLHISWCNASRRLQVILHEKSCRTRYYLITSQLSAALRRLAGAGSDFVCRCEQIVAGPPRKYREVTPPREECRVRLLQVFAFGELAPLDGKLSCPVLRGQWGRKSPALPDPYNFQSVTPD